MFLSQLGLQLPTGSNRGQNVVEKKVWSFPQAGYYEQNVSDNWGT
jgi:hypothetical protein